MIAAVSPCRRKSFPRKGLGLARPAPRAVSPLVVMTYVNSKKLWKTFPNRWRLGLQNADNIYIMVVHQRPAARSAWPAIRTVLKTFLKKRKKTPIGVDKSEKLVIIHL